MPAVPIFVRIRGSRPLVLEFPTATRLKLCPITWPCLLVTSRLALQSPGESCAISGVRSSDATAGRYCVHYPRCPRARLPTGGSGAGGHGAGPAREGAHASSVALADFGCWPASVAVMVDQAHRPWRADMQVCPGGSPWGSIQDDNFENRTLPARSWNNREVALNSTLRARIWAMLRLSGADHVRETVVRNSYPIRRFGSGSPKSASRTKAGAEKHIHRPRPLTDIYPPDTQAVPSPRELSEQVGPQRRGTTVSSAALHELAGPQGRREHEQLSARCRSCTVHLVPKRIR